MKDSGIINIIKPEGFTSQDVCAKLRRTLGTRRVGHAGTLDPMATGVLPICFGRATRVIEYYDEDWKTYEAEIRLGITTDTLDSTGEVLTTAPYEGVTEEDVRRATARYHGEISQIPPKYSALKVNGRPLYELARAGKEIDLEQKRRTVTVKDFEILSFRPEEGMLSFRITCSKGTYIRSISAEIGETLGTGAVMTSLVRTASGVFKIEDGYSLEEFLAMSEKERDRVVLSPEETLASLGRAVLAAGSELFYFNGRLILGPYIKSIEQEGRGRFRDTYALYSEKGDFLGTVQRTEEGYRPLKVLGDRTKYESI